MAVLSRREHTGDRHRHEDALIAAARELLREGTPYAALSIGAIAERAGLARTAFYVYFRDKRELLLSATQRFVGGLFDDADRWWSGSGGRAELHTAISNVIAHYRGSADLVRALVEAAGYDEVIARYWQDEIERFVSATEARLLRDGHDAGEARGIATALTWMVERTCYQQVLLDDPDGDDAQVDGLVTVWSRTLSLGP